MTSLRLSLPHGEEMHSDIGLPRFSIVHETGTDIVQPNVWYVMKQLILPHDINEVTMQKEILTQPKVAPSTLDQGCAWLGRDATLIESMHKNRSASASTYRHHLCPRGLEWHYPVLSNSWQHLGQSISQASVEGI